jgi:hypothetical protein
LHPYKNSPNSNVIPIKLQHINSFSIFPFYFLNYSPPFPTPYSPPNYSFILFLYFSIIFYHLLHQNPHLLPHPQIPPLHSNLNILKKYYFNHTNTATDSNHPVATATTITKSMITGFLHFIITTKNIPINSRIIIKTYSISIKDPLAS